MGIQAYTLSLNRVYAFFVVVFTKIVLTSLSKICLIVSHIIWMTNKSEVSGMEISSSNDSPGDDFWRRNEGISKTTMRFFLVRKFMQ